ncbi:Serine/threonine-protein phosphatase 2A regulatory subunit B'' subunit alpha [Podila verticillata]|nr:Serine/threonine-protein phosphatase 2A regulatory subunit B'' subunit alpha [Podila verticillata]
MYADILKASIKATSTPTLPSLGAASSPNLTSSPSPLLSASVASGTISSSSTSSANDSGSYKSRLIASLTPTRSMKPLRRPSLFNSKSDNNIKERLEKARVEAAKSGATPLKSLLSLEPTDGPSSGSSNSSSTETGERGFSEPSTMEIDDKSEYSEESSCQENEKGQGEIDMTDYTSSEDVEMTTCDTTLETVVEVGALDLNSSFVRSPLSVGLHTNGRTKKEDMSTASSPEALRRFQSVVAGSMMDIQDQEVTEVVVDRTADKSGAMAVGQQVDVSLRKAEASLEHKEPLRSSTNTVQPQQQQPAESLVEEVCPFQQQLALQEQTALEIEQQQAEEDAKNNHGRLGGSFKSRRKRNSSAGGKKLQLKKKLSLPNLHISFQQSRQDSPTLMSLKRLESGGLSATTPMTPASVIPPFYFPLGRPVAATKRRQRVHSAVTKAKEIFAVAESGALAEDGFVVITVQCCELPRYMNRALFRKADLSGSGEVRFQEFERVWESLVETCPDEISMIFMILKQPSANVLTPTDFEVVLQDLVLFHPGLEFLAGNSVFQERYLETVITRIFYEANRRHGKMSLADLRKSGFEKTLRKLENSDLNQTEDCFSYKHFYVIYCKFWELDQDHDLILDEKDLTGYAGGAISSRVIRRVMQGYGNETGMFMVPDQEILFLQQQQVLIQQQQQQQQQQLQQQAASQIQTQDQSMEQAQDTGAVAVNMDVDQELATAIEAIVRDGASDGALKDQINDPSDLGTPSLDGATTRIDSPMTGASESTLMARSTPPGPGSSCRPQNYRMTYKGFIWFLLAETDKQTVTSIEYWFRCMDLDGDGILTVFELEQLFQEQAQRMSILGMESFGFRDAICQMQDLVSPRDCGWVRLADLKQCGQAGPFIDLFCNVVRWRAFEAHQHQIRMRQQQIAMQRAADAAWEEVASGEEIFDDDDDEEDGEDGDDDGDDEEDDYDEDYDDDDDEEEGFGEDFDDEEEIEVSGGQALLRQKDLLLRNTKASMSTTDVSMVESESGGSIRGSKSSPLLSSALDQEANCIGLGVEMVQHVELENNGRENHQGGRRVTKVIVDESAPSSQSFHDASLEQASGGQMMPNKTLRRTRTKEKRRRQKSLMRRALLEEQRKEKALLATIRESPWLVYVEAEYEKLVTIERPQSRTGWEQDEEDEEEDEEEEEEEIEEDEVDEEEVMEEEEMMEQGREGTPGQAQAATAAAIGQNLSSKHIDIEDANLLASLSDSEGEGGVPKAVVSGKMTTTTTTGSAIFEIGHDFEQISMDNGSMD